MERENTNGTYVIIGASRYDLARETSTFRTLVGSPAIASARFSYREIVASRDKCNAAFTIYYSIILFATGMDRPIETGVLDTYVLVDRLDRAGYVKFAKEDSLAPFNDFK